MLYTNGEDDWSEMLEETPPSATEPQNITYGHGGGENFREIATVPEYEMNNPSPGSGGYNVEKFREIATVPEYEMEPDYPTEHHHQGYPPEHHQAGYPTEQQHQGYPTEHHQSGYPTEQHHQGYPTEHHQGYPTEHHQSGYPTEHHQGYPPQQHQGYPPEPEHPKRNNSVSFRSPARNEQPVTQLTQEEVKKEADEITQLVKMASKKPFGLFHAVGSASENEDSVSGPGDGYGEGIPVLNRKTSAPVLPYGSPRSGSEEKEPPPVRRKSSELSTSMKSRLELFMKQDDDDSKVFFKRYMLIFFKNLFEETTYIHDDTNIISFIFQNQKQRIVEPDNTFREKLQNFRKISEPQPEDPTPKGPKPKLSYTNLIGSNFSQQSQPSNSLTTESSEDHDDSVDQLLDDALEESYRDLEETNEEVNYYFFVKKILNHFYFSHMLVRKQFKLQK